MRKDGGERMHGLVIVPSGRVASAVVCASIAVAPVFCAATATVYSYPQGFAEVAMAALLAAVIVLAFARQSAALASGAILSACGSIRVDGREIRLYWGARCVRAFRSDCVAVLRRTRGWYRVPWYRVELVGSARRTAFWLWVGTATPRGPFEELIETLKRDSSLVPDSSSVWASLRGREDWTRAHPPPEDAP